MTPEERLNEGRELAKQARLNAYNNYIYHAWEFLVKGDALDGYDDEGAYAYWCDGMAALTAAFKVKEGLER
jgi:hypothetical protein